MGVRDTFLVSTCQTSFPLEITYRRENTMRELSLEEMKQVNGGILPILAAVGSFAGHMGVRSVGKYLFTRAMTSYAVYEAAKFSKG